MKNRSGISQQLWQAFLIQAGLISLVAISSIYAARFVVGDILIRRALQEEANHFWQLYDQEPNVSRANTYNLTGHLQPGPTAGLSERSLQRLPQVTKPARHSDNHLCHRT